MSTKSKTKFESIKEENAYYNELVSIRLFKDNDKYKDDVFVAVNGVGMIVPRGVDVKIPRKYAEAIKNSEIQDGFCADYQASLCKSANSKELSE